MMVPVPAGGEGREEREERHPCPTKCLPPKKNGEPKLAVDPFAAERADQNL
jgi:hypothetical protein